MTDTNDKFRSLFLTALLVFSVFAGTVALSGGAAAANFDDSGAQVRLDAGQRYWGQTVWFEGQADTTYEVWTADNNGQKESFVQAITTGSDGTATFSTTGMNGAYVLVQSGSIVTVKFGDIGFGTESVFYVTTQTLSTSFSADSVTNEGELTLDISSNRGMYSLVVTAEGLSEADLLDIFGQSFSTDDDSNDDGDILLETVSDGSYTTNFSGISPGNYTFTFDVTDTKTAANASVEVTEAGGANVVFVDDVVKDDVGDIVEIPLSFENTQQATITIGSPDVNYWIVAEVTDGNDDGKVVVEFNSFLAGFADDGVEIVLEAANADDNVTYITSGGAYISRNSILNSELLATTTYQMNVTEGHDGYTGANEYGALALTDRETTSLSTWVVSGNEDLTTWDAATIAAGVGTNVTQASEIVDGGWAVFKLEASGFEGIYAYLDVLGINPITVNVGGTFTIDHTNPGPNSQGVIVNMNYVDSTVIKDAANDTYYLAIDTGSLPDFAPGREFDANFTIGTDSPLNIAEDGPVTLKSSFKIVSASSSLDTTEDGTIVLESASNQTISGTSNLAPGTELRVTVQSAETTEPYYQMKQAVVQADGTFVATFDVSLPAGTPLTITLDAANSIEYDGTVVEQMTPTTTPEPETDTPTATPEPETDTPTDTATATEAPEDTQTEAPDTDTPTEESGPGFTVVIALGALVAAALLAIRRND